jgi:cob(I)alamin adenosyltransferase
MKKNMLYTKTGDKGKTSLIGGKRVPKTHIRLETYGTIDELNSFVGWLTCVIEETVTKNFLAFVQHKLFNVCSYLATDTENSTVERTCRVTDDDVSLIEKEIDRLDISLPKLSRFVLPGGNEAAARAHICRTVCRRAEREVFRLKKKYPIDQQILSFINRLSDYFFVLARHENLKSGREMYCE